MDLLEVGTRRLEVEKERLQMEIERLEVEKMLALLKVLIFVLLGIK